MSVGLYTYRELPAIQIGLDSSGGSVARVNVNVDGISFIHGDTTHNVSWD